MAKEQGVKPIAQNKKHATTMPLKTSMKPVWC